MSRFTKIIVLLCRLALGTSLVVLLASVAYCWMNTSGHSGYDPLLVSWFFVPVFAFGLLGRILTKGRSLSARALEVTGFIGIAFGFFVTRLGILNQYGDWIAAGMPDRPPHTSLLLAGFTIGALGGSLAIAYLITPRAEAPVSDERPAHSGLKSQ